MNGLRWTTCCGGGGGGGRNVTQVDVRVSSRNHFHESRHKRNLFDLANFTKKSINPKVSHTPICLKYLVESLRKASLDMKSDEINDVLKI
jgi:hypothetical protein